MSPGPGLGLRAASHELGLTPTHPSVCPSVADKRRDEDYDEQVEETLQDEVGVARHHTVEDAEREGTV